MDPIEEFKKMMAEKMPTIHVNEDFYCEHSFPVDSFSKQVKWTYPTLNTKKVMLEYLKELVTVVDDTALSSKFDAVNLEISARIDVEEGSVLIDVDPILIVNFGLSFCSPCPEHSKIITPNSVKQFKSFKRLTGETSIHLEYVKIGTHTLSINYLIGYRYIL